jgi:hypothetical protein
MGARIVGGAGAGGANCSATFCEFEQLSVLAATTRTMSRRIRILREQDYEADFGIRNLDQWSRRKVPTLDFPAVGAP